MKTFMRSESTGPPTRTTTGEPGLAPLPDPAGSVAWIIAASSFAFAVIQLDVTIVNVALSTISAEMRANVAELQWVVDAYTLGFAALLLSAGLVGDWLGSKRVFAAGFIVFAFASLACGLAPASAFSTSLERSKELEPRFWSPVP